MVSKESPHKCSSCGNPLLPHAKFCTQCGHKIQIDPITPSVHKEPDVEQPPVKESLPKEDIISDVEPSVSISRELKTTFDQGFELLASLRENLSSVIVILGIFSILAAVAFTVIVLLPREIISDIEIPPLEGFIFDLFVIFGLIGLLAKETLVYLGYIPKKETLDRWFSFVLLLLFWTNMITFSIGLVITSLFFQIGLDLPAVFVFLSLIIFVIAFLYFRRYQESLFSCTFIISVMSIVYLVQWIAPVDPMIYTTVVFLVVAGVVIISYQAKDLIIFTGLSVLLPLMFLSPYLLSNSIVIAIILLLVLFPFVEITIQKLILDKEELNWIKPLGELSSTFGMFNVSFSVFYGHLLPELSILILMIPVLGSISLKVFYSDFRRLPLRDGATIIFLVFTLVFFDFILENLLILFGVAVLLVIYSTFTVFEYVNVRQEKLLRYVELLLIASLVVVSMTRLLFIWKICLVLIPLFSLLVLIQQKKPINYQTARGFVFGSEVLILLAFIQSPAFDLLIIPIFSFIAIIGIIILFILNKEESRIRYSLDLTIFSLIFEATLLVMMLWTESSVEMLYPVVILIFLTIMISITQIRQRITPNFLWINSSFIICFGLMSYWNEFEVIWTVFTVFLTVLPMLFEGFLIKNKENNSITESTIKSRNLNISISAIGLALIVFFEELDPISHSVIFITIPIIWVVLYFLDKQYFNSLSELLMIISPGLIFSFEMLLKQTIFTPITDIKYLYLTLLAFSIPVISLQVNHFLKRKTKAPINPIIIGTTLSSLIIMIALWTYTLHSTEYLFLISGLLLALIVSTFLVKWQYESILLLLVSFFPSTIYAGFFDLPSSLLLYLIPIFPLLLNFVMGLKYLKTDLSVYSHEFIMLAYFGILILFSPIKLIEYTTFLFALFQTSWLFLGLLKRVLNQKILVLTNLVNSAFVLVLMAFIEPLITESFLIELGIRFPLRTTLIGLILIVVTIVMLIHLVSWQIRELETDLSYLMALILIFNSSALILSAIQLTLRTTDISLTSILFGILILFTILLISSIISYIGIKRLKNEISLACIYTTTAWVVLSSFFFTNIELVFLWLFFGPLMVIVFLAKQERTIILMAIIFYFIAGLRLIEYTLEFLVSGIADWVTILGLIVFGIELVSLGIYSSISGKNKKTTLVHEV
ncbi:MAG: zinc ribbon domain-containing protein [Candidatus Heimdallarchaeota archaeon]|nr:MAG: zinc ribbon domain-containing protein [Candidatus Heimdallarchaeota archaeon]